MNNPAISLFELNRLIKNVLEETLPEMFWVRAETSDVRVNQNGHCYLEFIEREKSGKALIAKARGMIWANTFRTLKAYFEKATQQTFTSGLKVLVQVSVVYHELYGLSLTVHDIDPGYTLGDQALNRAAILKQLEEEGVLYLNKELSLPLPINRIAVISSPTAAGYEDFLDQLNKNASGFVFYTKLFPAIMQGDRSEDSIIHALEKIYEYIENFDVVVIIRGGGATSDLSSFDSYLLAASCAQFPLPVITGIGHERDETVLDIVAHTRAKTPTAVAEFLIDNMASTFSELVETGQNIASLVQQRLQNETIQLSVFETRNTLILKSWYKEQQNILASVQTILIKRMFNVWKESRNILVAVEDRIKVISSQNIKKEQERLNTIGELLNRNVHQLLKDQSGKLDATEKHLQLSSPETILKKGYTLTMKDGKVVKQHVDLKKGDSIKTVFYNGEIDSIVK